MEFQRLNIVQLINNSPITKLSNKFQTKLITKIQNSFTDDQQQLFVASFYSYLDYNSKSDFVINLDDVWKWCGFSRKGFAKTLLVKHFIENRDYKIQKAASAAAEAGHSTLNLGGAGLNKETILMTINTFKKFCLKSSTKRADEIHDYYIKLEELLQEVIMEEAKELQYQLQEKEDLLIEQKEELQEKEELLIQQKEQTQLEKEELLEKTLISQFPRNTQCIYYGTIVNKDSVGGNLVKFGMSNNLPDRIKTHKKTYENFKLKNAFKVTNQIEIENCIKKHPVLKNKIRNLMISDICYRELICIDPCKKEPEFCIEKLESYIKEIIEENQYNIENYKKLLVKNDNMAQEIYTLNEKVKALERENSKLKNKLPSAEEHKLMRHNKNETNGGYSLFAFNCTEQLRYKIGICKTATLNLRQKVYEAIYPETELKLQVKIKHALLEKVNHYLLKKHLCFLNNDTFDGTLDDIQLVFNIISKLEDILTNNDLQNILKILNNEKIEVFMNDPEIPFVKKAKRSIDQIDPVSGKIIASYPSIEAAGKALHLTTGTAIGVALRNKTLCKGFLWRYSGISKEDQMKDQPVIKINCSTAEQQKFPNIASAAQDAKVSAPGLRNRILTNVHVNGYHWIFNTTATHYN
jgi:hypothetical protein